MTDKKIILESYLFQVSKSELEVVNFVQIVYYRYFLEKNESEGSRMGQGNKGSKILVRNELHPIPRGPCITARNCSTSMQEVCLDFLPSPLLSTSPETVSSGRRGKS